MKTSIDDLREHLFETIEGLKDKDNPMDIGRAKAICEVSQQLINSAKVEVEFLRVTDSVAGSKFLTNEKPKLPQYGGQKQIEDKP